MQTTIKIVPAHEASSPAGKLCDAEIHFGEDAGILAGLKLIGFALWAPRSANAGRNVTYPARTYSVNGERRSFALLRPIGDSTWILRDAISAAYDAHQQQEAAHQGAPMLPTTLTADGLARLEF